MQRPIPVETGLRKDAAEKEGRARTAEPEMTARISAHSRSRVASSAAAQRSHHSS